MNIGRNVSIDVPVFFSSTDDDDVFGDEHAQAATKIQAGFRGQKARKEVIQRRQSESAAATKIQAGFRGQKTRKDVKQRRESESAAATKIQAGYRGQQARREVKQKRDSETEAATKIQAGFRGTQARKQVNSMKESSQSSAKHEDENEDEEIDAAATKIQSGFRGKKARDQVKQMRQSLISGDYEKPEDLSEDQLALDQTDEDVFEGADLDAAATKIQSGFRGAQARKQVKEIRSSIIEDGEEIPVRLRERREVADEAELLEQQLAATKIQAGFRGTQARKQVQQMKESHQEDHHSTTETSEYSPGYFELHGISTDQEDTTISSIQTHDRLKLAEVPSVKGSMESQVSVEDTTIKENMTEKDAKTKDNEESEEEEDIDTEFLEDDFDDLTESSASVSEKSANAPIRNKKVPFTLIRKILNLVVKPNKVGVEKNPSEASSHGSSAGNGSSKQSRLKGPKRSTKVEPVDNDH